VLSNQSHTVAAQFDATQSGNSSFRVAVTYVAVFIVPGPADSLKLCLVLPLL